MALKLTKRPGTDNWYIRGSMFGQSRRKSTGTSRRSEAEKILERFIEEIRTEAFEGPKATAIFADAIAAYLDAKSISEPTQKFLARINKHLGQVRLSQIDQAAVKQCAEEIYPNTKTATKIRQCYTPIMAVLNHAADCGLCGPIRIKKPKIPQNEKSERSVPDTEWFAKMHKVCNPNLWALIMFLRYTGARVSEALAVQWSDIDAEQRTVRIYMSKTDRPRICAIHPDLWDAIQATDHRTGRVIRYASRNAVYPVLRAACERAGVPYHPTHEFGRHSLATAHLKAGGNVKEAQELGGWKDGRHVMDTYGHLEQSHIHQIARNAPSVLSKSAQNAPSTPKRPMKRKRSRPSAEG